MLSTEVVNIMLVLIIAILAVLPGLLNLIVDLREVWRK